MTPPEIPLADLATRAGSLLADKAVVALVPGTPEDPTAIGAAWEIARAAATGRRVALVDVSLEHPALDGGASAVGPEGLVDAFEFGSSLTHVAQEQAPGLFYIPVGTSPSDPQVVRSHDRWERLSRGFASQGALLLLYVPAQGLQDLAVKPDAVLQLAGGEPPVESIQGIPVLAAVAQPASEESSSRRSTFRPAWRPVLLGAGGVLGAGAIGVFILSLLPTPPAPDEPAAPAVGPTPPPAAPAAVPPPVPTVLPDPTGDTLFYTVQVAAFNRLAPASEHAGELVRAGHPASVSPVRVGSRAVTWYRVLAGAVATTRAADSIRRALWDARLVERRQGVILRTPTAYELDRHASRPAATRAAEGLRERGLPAYIVAGSNGVVRVLFGAFENQEQATAADSLLAAFGLRGSLVSRIGIPE